MHAYTAPRTGRGTNGLSKHDTDQEGPAKVRSTVPSQSAKNDGGDRKTGWSLCPLGEKRDWKTYKSCMSNHAIEKQAESESTGRHGRHRQNEVVHEEVDCRAVKQPGDDSMCFQDL